MIVDFSGYLHIYFLLTTVPKYIYTKISLKLLSARLPASVAQLDARPTDDLDFAGSTPAGSATFVR